MIAVHIYLYQGRPEPLRRPSRQNLLFAFVAPALIFFSVQIFLPKGWPLQKFRGEAAKSDKQKKEKKKKGFTYKS